jgi:HTH-type transcriptional regulator, competence development regulator
MADRPSQLVAFGRTIRKARRDKDLSQEALAAMAGVSPKHLGEIERARKDPRLTTIVKLAGALELRSGELLTLFDERMNGG